MSEPVTLKIDLPKIPDIELVAIEGLNRLAHHLGISDEKIGEARILVTEAVINGFEHAGMANPKVSVEFTMNNKELTILVRDYGHGFVPSEIESPDIRQKLGTGKHKRGWGLELMKSMSDDFKIDSNDSGTLITIKKILN